MEFYLIERYFQVEVTEIHPDNAGVPQGNILGPALYLLYNAEKIRYTFVDDTDVLCSSGYPAEVNEILQTIGNLITSYGKMEN